MVEIDICLGGSSKQNPCFPKHVPKKRTLASIVQNRPYTVSSNILVSDENFVKLFITKVIWYLFLAIENQIIKCSFVCNLQIFIFVDITCTLCCDQNDKLWNSDKVLVYRVAFFQQLCFAMGRFEPLLRRQPDTWMSVSEF